MARIQKALWGTHDHRDVFLFTFENRNGMKATITNYGGIIVSLTAPDREGGFADVVLGFDRFEDYQKTHPFFGALVGRYANRIADASFALDGVEYALLPSEGKNQLHGGPAGFDKKVWDAAVVPDEDGDVLVLSYFSRDGEQGYPGNLDVTVMYELTEDNALRIDYLARSDADTIVNLTNHSYFNLAGQGSGDVLAHELQLMASHYTIIGDGSIPTGELRHVEGTPFDFREATAIGARIGDDDEQLKRTKGYDHNFVIDEGAFLPDVCAIVRDPASGRVMKVLTDKPGVQLYTGNFLDGTLVGKGGGTYGQHAGLCLETQFFPDSPNQPEFPSCVLKAGEQYDFTTIYAFSAE